MNERPTRVRYVVLFGLCLAAGLAYIHRGCLGVAESTIRGDLGIGEKDMSWAMGIFFFTYALFQIPTGLLVDRWGARRSLLLFGLMGAFTLALGAGTLLLGTTAGFIVLLSSRALMGVAQAGLFPAATRCIATWFPIRRRAFAAGTLQAFMSVGGAIGAVITGSLLLLVSWPWVFVIFAVPGVLWSVWFFSWYRDNPEEHPSVNKTELEFLAIGKEGQAVSRDLQPDGKANLPPETPIQLGPTPWLQLATRSKLIWLCTSQFFRAGANVFWLTWCATYLQETFHVDKKEAGELTSIPFLGVVLGSLAGGLLADRVLASTGSKRWSRNGVAIITSAIGVVFFVLTWLLPVGPIIAIVLLFLAALFSSCANPCTYSVSIDIGGRFMAIVFGAMNMSGNIGATIFPRIGTLWKDQFGWEAMPLLMALLYLLGIVCWFFVNPNGTILEKEESKNGSPDAARQ